MTSKKRLKELYKKCLDEKWSYDNEEIIIGDFCAFCYDTDERKDVYCSVNGDGCRDFCLIDRSICGSEGSLMDILNKLTDEYDVTDVRIENAMDNVREALKKRI